MDSDLACSTQTKIFGDKFPDRFFDCGIAEQDMVATAAGLASEGKVPFVASFAMFATGRTYDQIRNGICYPDFNVKIIWDTWRRYSWRRRSNPSGIRRYLINERNSTHDSNCSG